MATSTPDTAPIANAPTTPEIDIIYHNMHAGSDFRTFRASSKHSLKSRIRREESKVLRIESFLAFLAWSMIVELSPILLYIAIVESK